MPPRFVDAPRELVARLSHRLADAKRRAHNADVLGVIEVGRWDLLHADVGRGGSLQMEHKRAAAIRPIGDEGDARQSVGHTGERRTIDALGAKTRSQALPERVLPDRVLPDGAHGPD